MAKESKMEVGPAFLPWRHGSRSAESSEQQQDWSDFQDTQQVRAIDNMMSLMSNKFMMYLSLVMFVKDLLLGLKPLQQAATSGFLLCCIARAAVPFCRRSVRENPVKAGITIQVFVAVWLHAVLAIVALSIEDELLKHRYYLTSHSCCLLLLLLLGSLPTWVHLWVVGPIYFTFWLTFHLKADYMRAPVILIGLVLCFGPAGLSILLEQVQWQQFSANRQLDRERHALEETQKALHRLLSSQWDASCTVDSDGTIASSSPHLNQLIASGSDIQGLKLSMFVSNSTDTARLVKFLKSALTGEDSQALSLNCSFQPRSVFGEENVPIEVVLYGIRLPGGSAFNGGQEGIRGQVFIGIKSGGVGAKEPEVLVGSAETSLFDADALPVNARLDASSDASSLADLTALTESSLQGMKGASRCTGNASCKSLGTLDYTMSESTGPVTSIEAAREHQALCGRRSVHIATQTDECEVKAVAVQTCSRPPPLPPPGHLREGGQCRPKFASKPRKLLNEFQKTKLATLVYLLEQVKLRVNVRGSGCCRWHIASEVLQKQLKAQAAAPCQQHFLPYRHLQCAECLAMNEADEDMCGVCCCPIHVNRSNGNERQVLHQESTPREVLDQELEVQVSSPSQERSELASWWQCKLCFALNKEAVGKCAVCYSIREQQGDEPLADDSHRPDDDFLDTSLKEQWLHFM